MAGAVAPFGVEATVAATTADGSGELAVPIGDPIVEDGVRYIYFPRQRPKQWSLSLPLAAWLRRSVRDYDVLHIHSLFSFPTLAAADAARRAGIPYVLRPLGSLDPWSLERGRWKKRMYLGLIDRQNLERAAAVHTTSERERQSVESVSAKINATVVPIGVAVASTSPDQRDVRQPGAPVRLLFLSRLHPKKGLELLIDALARLRGSEWHLDIAGDGEPVYVAALRRTIQDLGYEKQTTLHGFVTGDRKRQLFASADLFVLPSHDENFGLVVAEAMAAGLPVIVSSEVAISRDVSARSAGLVVPLDAAALGSALATLVSDDALRARLGANARVLAGDEFGWSVVAPRLAELYMRAARLAPAGPR